VVHKDRHFALSWRQKATSRRWSLSPEEWSQLPPNFRYEAVSALADILDDSNSKHLKRKALFSIPVEILSLPDVVLPATDDRDYRCCVCSEVIQKQLNNFAGEWSLLDSCMVSTGNPNIVCHKGCKCFLSRGTALIAGETTDAPSSNNPIKFRRF
jgi:hypothetical protein